VQYCCRSGVVCRSEFPALSVRHVSRAMGEVSSMPYRENSAQLIHRAVNQHVNRFRRYNSLILPRLGVGGEMAIIPKIIHQTWKSTDLPVNYTGYQSSVKTLHPDWEYRLWTDKDNRDLIERQFPWFLDTYDSYSHEIERVDAVRYFILYTFGGVYMDLDMECLKPIDELLENQEKPHFSQLALPTLANSVIGNALMASPPRHPFFGYLIKRLPALRQQDITHADVLNNTGPYMLDRQLRAFGAAFGFGLIGLEQACDRGVLHQLPGLAGKSLAQIREGRLIHVIHHHTNSWNLQHPAPAEPIPGYRLYLAADIHDFDIDYVEYEAGDYAEIAARCGGNPEAIGFNFNGYIKGVGGKITPYNVAGNDWLKEGIVPWVCVKETAVNSVK